MPSDWLTITTRLGPPSPDARAGFVGVPGVIDTRLPFIWVFVAMFDPRAELRKTLHKKGKVCAFEGVSSAAQSAALSPLRLSIEELESCPQGATDEAQAAIHMMRSVSRSGFGCGKFRGLPLSHFFVVGFNFGDAI